LRGIDPLLGKDLETNDEIRAVANATARKTRLYNNSVTAGNDVMKPVARS
jgi:hypothetical protein